MEEYKTNIINEINSEIENCEYKMQSIEKNTKEYSLLSLKCEVLRKEINILSLLDSKSSEEFFNEIRKIRVNEIKMIDDFDTLINLLYSYKKYYDGLDQYKDFIQTKDFVDNLNFLDNDFKNKILNIKTLNQFDFVIANTKNSEKVFDEAKTRFLASVKNFDIEKYIRLKTKVTSNVQIDYKELNNYKGMGADGLIEKIFNKIDIINNKKLLSEKSKNNEINNIVNFYLKELIMLIEDYIKKAYLINNYYLKLNVESDNFIDFYSKIINDLARKSDYYNNIDKNTFIFRYLIHHNQNEFTANLLSSNIKYDDLADDEKNDFYNISFDELFNYIVNKDLSVKLTPKKEKNR